MKFYVNYFGCRTNQAEIQEWIIDLENSGYELARSIDEADFGIINTCSVTEKAERDVLRFIQRINKRSDKKWIITGCTVSKENSKLSDRYQKYLFLDNREKHLLPQSVREIFPLESHNLIYHSAFRSRIFLKIQDGCNHRCSFCIVPSLRGKSVSIPPPDIIRRIKYYTTLGYREVVLTGINLSSYGYDLFPRENLLDLIKKISEIKKLAFIRLSSLDPRYIKYGFIKELNSLRNVARSFHLSIQSGSNSVLKNMNRSLKSTDLGKTLETFHHFFPDANFGADILVGFPGEEEKHFQETVDFIKKSPLNYLHIFPFSPREHTRAEEMKPLPLNIIKNRVRILKEINQELRLDYREKFLGKILEGILIEENRNHSLVVTDNFLTVRVPPLKGYRKKKIKVKIGKVINTNLCEGEVIRI
jgi:threonylcarbamoyladenosine tRNA methylthiotransferase MtaB